MDMTMRATSLPPRRWASMVLGALALLVASSSGCKPKRTRVPALCSFDGLSDEEREAQALSPIIWMTLTSPTVDRQAMARTGPLSSACGQVLQPTFSDDFACPGFEETSQRIEPDAIEESDLIMNSAGEDRMLLWAATDELTSGEAEGAAALALWTESAVEVHAVGRLRGYRQGARMRLHSIGSTPVLVLQGDRCDASGQCTQIGQVVPILNRRLAELPLWEEGAGCIGRAQFELEKREERDLGNGVVRRFALTRNLELTDEGIFVTDLLTMDDLRRDGAGTDAQPYRKINARRPLLLEADRLVLEDEGMWDRALRDHGQVDPDGASGPQD